MLLKRRARRQATGEEGVHGPYSPLITSSLGLFRKVHLGEHGLGHLELGFGSGRTHRELLGVAQCRLKSLLRVSEAKKYKGRAGSGRKGVDRL